MQKVLIVEDDSIQRTSLAQAINNNYPDWMIDTADCFEAAKENILHSLDSDDYYTLFLLDIQLTNNSGDRGGFFLAEMLRKEMPYYKTPILFLTAVSDDNYYALSHFHCYNYISKPYTSEDIIRQLEQMLVTGYLSLNTFEIIDTSRIIHRCDSCNLKYIKSEGHVLLIQCENFSFRTRNYTIESIHKILNQDFVQCHKQYIINFNFVTNFDRLLRVINLDSETIPVGKKYLANIDHMLRLNGARKNE